MIRLRREAYLILFGYSSGFKYLKWVTKILYKPSCADSCADKDEENFYKSRVIHQLTSCYRSHSLRKYKDEETMYGIYTDDDDYA